MPIKKIVVIGPESTGKSTLCSELAEGYQGDWVPEYARQYLLTHGTNYHYEDLLIIAKKQLEGEDAHAAALEKKWADQGAIRSVGTIADGGVPGGGGPDGLGPGSGGSAPVLFIDTDMYVMKVWCEFVFGKCHTWILDQITARHYDGYLLCRTDLPWVKDELREYPDLISREKLYHIYRDSMINQSTPWAEIGGAADQRLTMAVAAVDQMIGPGHSLQ